MNGIFQRLLRSLCSAETSIYSVLQCVGLIFLEQMPWDKVLKFPSELNTSCQNFPFRTRYQPCPGVYQSSLFRQNSNCQILPILCYLVLVRREAESYYNQLQFQAPPASRLIRNTKKTGLTIPNPAFSKEHTVQEGMERTVWHRQWTSILVNSFGHLSGGNCFIFYCFFFLFPFSILSDCVCVHVYMYICTHIFLFY